MTRSLMTTLALALAAILAGVGPVVNAQSLIRVDQVSHSDFAKTVSQVKTAIQSKGLMIVATIDHQNMMRMVGISSKGATTIEFGKPDMGKMVFLPDAQAGLDMPLRLYIWQRQDGTAVVSYYKISPVFASYGKDNLKMAGEMMDKMLAEIVAEGTK